MILDNNGVIQGLKSGRSNKDIAKEIGCDPSLISIYKKRIETEGEIYG